MNMLKCGRCGGSYADSALGAATHICDSGEQGSPLPYSEQLQSDITKLTEYRSSDKLTDEELLARSFSIFEKTVLEFCEGNGEEVNIKRYLSLALIYASKPKRT
jgi:hypothetical protein